jgi:hypothetical protein
MNRERDSLETAWFKVGLANGNFRHLRMFIGFAYRAARIESTPENLHRLRTVLRQAKRMQADTEAE